MQRRIECPLAKVTTLAFSPDGHWLAAGGGEPGLRGEAVLSWPDGVLKHRFGNQEDLVTSIAFDTASRRLVSCLRRSFRESLVTARKGCAKRKLHSNRSLRGRPCRRLQPR